MKWMAMVVVALGSGLLAGAQSSVAGEWQIQRSVGGSESSQTCTFVQKDAELTGSCSTPAGAVQLTGTVNGKTVTWTIKQESSQGGTVTVAYKGTIETDTKMSGTVTAGEYGIDGEFVATKAK